MMERGERGAEAAAPNKAGLGCLLALLLGGALVSGFFAFVTVAAFVIQAAGLTPTEDFPGAADQGVNWFGTVALLVFTMPMFILFARGALLTLQRLRGKPTAGLVTWGMAAMLSLAYGVPGALAAITLVLFAPERVDMGMLFYGLPAIALLLAAPFFFRRDQRGRERASSDQG
jgi:hypothetical protein